MGQKFRMWLIRVMEGRYGTRGVDPFNRFLIIAYFALTVLNLLLSVVLGGTLLLPTVLSWAAFILFLFRTFSRNIPKREMENEKYLSVSRDVKRFFRRQVNRVKEFKTHRYRKCTHCKAVLRLPRRKGTMKVNCPRCRQEFSVKILF